MTNLDSIKNQRHYFANKGPSGLWFLQWSCMDVRVGLQRKLSNEELMILNCGFGEDLRVPWVARRSNQSILKKTSPEYFFGRTDAEADTPILWPPDVKNGLIGKIGEKKN